MSKFFELIQQSQSDEDLFRTSGKPAVVADEPSPEGSAPKIEKQTLRTPFEPGSGVDPANLRASALASPAAVEEFPVWISKATHQTDLVPDAPKGLPGWEEWRAHGEPIRLQPPATEEEIKLVSRVFLSGDRRAPQAVLFSGVDREGGSSTICARAGEILAARGEGPVCIVDANIRRPSLDLYFKVNNCKGFTEALLTPGPIQDFTQRLPQRNLWFMGSGRAAARSNLPLISRSLGARVAELRGAFRYLVFLTSPLHGDSDSMELSRFTDGVVLVVEANSTRRETARRVKEDLEGAGVLLLGAVMNNRSFPIPEAVYRKL